MTMTKKMQHQIVALFPQTGVIDLSSVPSSVTAITLSPRDIIELLDACVTETAGQERRLEKIKGGPVPKYQWIEMKRERGIAIPRSLFSVLFPHVGNGNYIQAEGLL